MNKGEYGAEFREVKFLEKPVRVYTNEPPMEINPAYLKVCTEHDIPYEELLAVADEIWDKLPAEQDEIRDRKAKEFALKYPLKDRNSDQHTPEGKEHCRITDSDNVSGERGEQHG